MHRTGESGQAVVEAALVFPGAVFLLLATVQLTLVQRARLLTELAAFHAARAGIVRNGDDGRSGGFDGPMRDAAAVAVLPAFGRVDSVGALFRTWGRLRAEEAALHRLGLPVLRVRVLSPARRDFAALATHLNGKEIDFDDVRPGAAEATLLSVAVTYLYELRVPFANGVLQALWLAAASRSGASQELLPALSAARRAHRYYVPIEATSTMRMQSNAFLRWAAP